MGAKENIMKYITEHEAEALYNELIDECNPIIKIFGTEYLPSHVLKELDPIAYNCGFNDWLDAADEAGEAAAEFIRRAVKTLAAE